MSVTTPGVTPSQAFEAHPPSFQNSITADSSDHVFRTGGCIAATAWKKGGNGQLIKPDQTDEETVKYPLNQSPDPFVIGLKVR